MSSPVDVTSLVSMVNQVKSLLLNGPDYRREKALRQLAQSNGEFFRFYGIINATPPVTGMRRRETIARSLAFFGPLLIIIVILYSVIGFSTHLSFFYAGLGVYVISLIAIPVVLVIAHSTEKLISLAKERETLNQPTYSLAIRLFQLKSTFQYCILISLTLLLSAFKTAAQTPSWLPQAVGSLQSYVFDFVLATLSLILLVLPLWLLRRVQRASVRRAEDAIFKEYFSEGSPSVELTVERKSMVDKVRGSIVSIGERMMVARSDGFDEILDWSSIISIAVKQNPNLFLY